MRTPGEVMTENRPSTTLTNPVPIGRTSPMESPERTILSNAASGAIEGINRAQLTLQELQDLTERQREQILYNSQELMEKQQQLMRMHQDYRARLKSQQQAGTKSVPKSLQAQHDTHQPHANFPQSPVAPRSLRSSKGKGVEADQYAKMLRKTYQNMGRIQSKNQLQHNVDVKKFNNIELTRELEKVRSVFASKQNELADAVKKVDVLTHELEQRKNGENNHAAVPTPERINRRKKIQNAKDELYRLQSELIIRNEMNSQQSHQLQLQRDIIAEKKQELRELNSRMAEIGSALRRQNGSGHDPRRSLTNYSSSQGGLFNSTYLQDTLSRKKHKQPSVKQDINANVIPNPSNAPNRTQFKNGLVNGYIPPKQKAFDQTPLTGNQVWRNDPQKSLNIQTNDQNKSSPLPSPSSSVSSLSSLSSASATPDDTTKKAFPFGKDAPPAPPLRTTPIGVLIDHNQPSEEEQAKLRAQKIRINELQQELREKTNISLKSYNDSKLSEVNDDYKYKQYSDAKNSYSNEVLSTVKPAVKPKPPPVLPKPSVASKPNTTFVKNEPPVDLENVPVIVSREADNDWLSPPSNSENIASEPDEFELSYADIDELQTDVWSSNGSGASQSSYESDIDDNIEHAVVPVVISVSPDKMPPPILMKPDKPRKQKRNVILDPFALLLDSALEGEMEVVKKTLMQVPDPSKPNPEGITALHNAVCGNHKEVVRYLVEVACDINSADNNGWTPLHCAAFYNDKELCRYLVENGASVFATTYTDYQTPAHKCSRLDENYDECFSYLHECKENVGRIDNGLVYAIYDYEGEHGDELSFINGDELTILRRGDNNEKEWWWARDRKGNTGYVPCNLIGNFARVEAAV